MQSGSAWGGDGCAGGLERGDAGPEVFFGGEDGGAACDEFFVGEREGVGLLSGLKGFGGGGDGGGEGEEGKEEEDGGQHDWNPSAKQGLG